MGLNAITIVSAPEPQVVVPDIITMVTEPAVLSAVLGIYVGLRTVLLGEKDPEPSVVQVTELAELIPLSTGLAAFGQRLRSEPALVKGELVNTICIVSTTCRQLPFPVEVRKIITVPAVVSALLGTYMVFMLVVPPLNVPVPALDHVAPVAMENEPTKPTDVVLAQTVWLDPALTTGAGVILTVNCPNTALHPPLLVEERFNVTVPADISPASGI